MWSCGILEVFTGVTPRGTAGPQWHGDDAQNFGAHHSKAPGDCREEVSPCSIPGAEEMCSPTEVWMPLPGAAGAL